MPCLLWEIIQMVQSRIKQNTWLPLCLPVRLQSFGTPDPLGRSTFERTGMFFIVCRCRQVSGLIAPRLRKLIRPFHKFRDLATSQFQRVCLPFCSPLKLIYSKAMSWKHHGRRCDHGVYLVICSQVFHFNNS